MYNGEDDASCAIQGNFYDCKSMKEMLSLLLNGKASDYPDHKADTGISAVKPVV
jgi:hypothetical protein